MSSFIDVKYPAEHPGVARFESALGTAHQLRRGFNSTKGLASMLLAALVAAMLVVVDQVIDNWANGQLLLAWIALWAVAFAALALFAGTARRLAVRLVAGLDAWSSSIAQARADVRMWEAAKTDPRVMADLRAAITREESGVQPAAAPAAAVPAALPKRTVRVGGAELRAYQRNYI